MRKLKAAESGFEAELPEDRVVAYIDILGFEDLVRRMHSGEPELFVHIRNALTYVRKRQGQNYGELSPHISFQLLSGREMTSFSDCVVISGPLGEEFSVMLSAGSLAAYYLQKSILSRGGVAVGPLFHRNEVVFGKALIDAYRLERDVAQYPRIIVQDAVAERVLAADDEPQGIKLNIRLSSILKRDTDGNWFLNVLVPPFATISAARLEDMDYAEEAYFRQLRKSITYGLQRHLRETPRDQSKLTKHRWLAEQFNTAIPKRLEQTITKIDLDKRDD